MAQVREGEPPPAPGWRVFFSTEGAVLLGAACVTAWATASPVFLALGAAGYSLVTAGRVRQLRAERAGAAWRLAAPDVAGLDGAGRYLALEGHAAAQAVLNEIRESPDSVRDLFGAAATGVRELYRRHDALVRRRQELCRGLARTDLPALRRQRDDLRARAGGTNDPAARRHYTAGARALDQSVASHEELDRDSRRIEAQLAGIRAALENARAQVLRARSAEARGAASEGVELASALDALTREVDTLNLALDEAFVTDAASERQAPHQERTRE
ncbi:MAG: hypothetical protein HYZ53_27285 [Planctomycetes bacterium]|nr:hypothetical protein [Planctomycetota bacterium]